MKISVCGKGGSGKSTVVTLLADPIRRYQVGQIVNAPYRCKNLTKQEVYVYKPDF